MMRRLAWWGAALLWLLVVGAGFAVLWRYSATAGAASLAPARWPTGSRIARAADRATLVMFVHPRCACSRASVTDLQRLLARVPDRVQSAIAFVVPDGVEPGWVKSD